MMLWHMRQLKPALASGRSTICLMGVSNMLLKSSAGSWQPAHHFEGFTPATSCMYSTLLRYHWLLNEEKWCAELCHCSYTSWWQRSHAFDSMKYFAGISLPSSVCAELGKNAPLGPSPSPFISAGASSGLLIGLETAQR